MISKRIKQAIFCANTIAIFVHTNPDGDALGSMLSLGLGLEQLGKKVYMIGQGTIPKNYSLLPAAHRIKQTINKKLDLAIAVDCSTLNVLGKCATIFSKARRTMAIDHHEFRRPFAQLRVVDSKAAAVGEIIYSLLKELHLNINRNIAYNILTSIIVETNSFRLPSVRPLTFKICAELVAKRIDFYKLTEMVYWVKTPSAAMLSGICLSRCKFLKQGQIVWSIIRREDFKKSQGSKEDVDALADEMRSIKGVKISILFREENKKNIRVSLRSKKPINVALLAESFGGGGHFDVAGCVIPNQSKQIRNLLAESVRLLTLTENKIKAR